MLTGENDDRKPLTSVPALSRIEDAAVKTPVGGGSSSWIWRCVAVALRSVRSAVLRARGAGTQSFLRALQELRQFGIAANRRGARPGDGCDVFASAADSGVAMRTVPA